MRYICNIYTMYTFNPIKRNSLSNTCIINISELSNPNSKIAQSTVYYENMIGCCIDKSTTNIYKANEIKSVYALKIRICTYNQIILFGLRDSGGAMKIRFHSRASYLSLSGTHCYRKHSTRAPACLRVYDDDTTRALRSFRISVAMTSVAAPKRATFEKWAREKGDALAVTMTVVVVMTLFDG